MALSLVSFRPGRVSKQSTKQEAAWEEFHPLSEQVFVPMLAQERKRSERSGKPFVLLLLRGNEAYVGDRGNEVVGRIVSTMRSTTRETDVLGWYETGEVLGIIFTEIGELQEQTLDIVLTRITAALSDSLEREDLDKVSITCHIYPEQTSKSSGGNELKLFFPDMKRKRPSRRFEHFLKRSFDVLGSLFALILLSPVFAVLAALVKLTSEGPVLYRQKRVGQFGQEFSFFKFRSMHVNNDHNIHKEFMKNVIKKAAEKNADSGSKSLYKMTNDPRITPLGRFIRRTSLDELPQFYNVLIGDMSLVGPRPPVPYEYDCYDIWHRKRVFEVKPGITGLWQVMGRSRVGFDDMVRLDLKYVRTWSLWLDLKILLKTPWAVIGGDGAY